MNSVFNGVPMGLELLTFDIILSIMSSASPKVTRKTFLSSGLAGVAPAVSFAQGQPRPKNVLFLLSDQHAPLKSGYMGDPMARTPNIDSLARTGTRFTNTYCTNPVCTPSRASILTGRYTHNHRTWNNATPWPFEIKTMAHAFSRAGYCSSLIGKMHFVDAQTHGFDYRLDFNDWFQYLGPKSKVYAEELSQANSGSGNPQIDDLWRDYGDPWKNVRQKDDRKGFVHVGRASLLEEKDHFENFVARESVRFLKNHGKQQPFFLISSFLKPHDPFMPGSRFAGMYEASRMPMPKTWNRQDLSTVPRETRDRIEFNRPTPEIKEDAMARQRIAMYYANIAHMDDTLGQVLAALKELDLEKDTIVIYSSDHGEMLGEHNLWQKFVFYDPSAGVPMIFRVPGMTRENSECRTAVSQTQIFATLCELCGISAPAGLDGSSMATLLREPEKVRTPRVYSEFALRTKNAKSMIREGDWKYCHYINDTPELYNLKDDPDELKNLAGGMKGKMDEMRGKLFDWHRPEASAG